MPFKIKVLLSPVVKTKYIVVKLNYKNISLQKIRLSSTCTASFLWKTSCPLELFVLYYTSAMLRVAINLVIITSMCICLLWQMPRKNAISSSVRTYSSILGNSPYMVQCEENSILKKWESIPFIGVREGEVTSTWDSCFKLLNWSVLFQPL